MKLKFAIALGLATFLGLGVGVGLKAHKAEIAKADADDAMFTVVIDLADAVGYTDFHKPEVHVYDAATSSIDKYEDLHQLSGTYYTANLTYKSGTQTVDHVQFLFKQTADANKWSNTIELTPTASYVYHFAFQNSWTGDNWDVAKDSWSGLPRVRGNDIADTNFTANVATKTYKVSNLELTAGTTYQIFFGKWGFGAVRETSVNNYLDNYSLNSFDIQFDGTYDIIAHNDYSDGGIFEIKMHSPADTRYIYYVLENNTPTTDYIYTWGGNEQFGAWPGTQITSVIGVEEVTGGGVLHFQGSETPKLIYKIPVQVGYPVGDEYFKFNNNDTMETATRPINGHSAYWWSGDANADAGYSIDLLVEAEEIRNLATDTSVCNISKSDATSIVNTYLSLGSYMQETYIDCTTVYTHKRDGSDGNELVTYREVIEQLAKIAEIDLSPSNNIFGIKTMNKVDVAIVIVVVASISAIALCAFVIRKRKENK